MKLLQTASILALLQLTQANTSLVNSIEEKLIEKAQEIEKVVENALEDFDCVLHTDNESCVNSIDAKSGGSCLWCTNAAVGGTHGACLSEEQASKVPAVSGFGVTCGSGDIGPYKSDEHKKLVAEFQDAMMKTTIDSVDFSCLINLDLDTCEEAADASGVACSWCDSTVYPKLRGCLTQEAAEALLEMIAESGVADKVGLSCQNEYMAVEKEKSLAQIDLTCEEITDPTTCMNSTDASGMPCEYCATVDPDLSMLNLCASEEQAELLPESMYTCTMDQQQPVMMTLRQDMMPAFAKEDNMVRMEKATAEDESKDESENEGMSYHEFSHVEGVKHVLRDDIIDKDFCDPESPKSVSGYMDVTGSAYDKDEEKHFYFWFFEKRESKTSLRTSDEHTPLIVWLSGGPGCSSTLALLFENGPCSVNLDGTETVPNPHSWNKVAHVLYVDQPAGVGFSHSKKDSKEGEKVVGEDMYYFLQSFYKAHPKYAKNPLFVVGESYGGHFAPAVAHRIHQGNKKLKDNLIHINLKGLAVGNGLTDPKVQYQHYAEMAYHNSHDIKTVPEKVYKTMEKATPACVEMINKCTSSQGNKFFCQVAENFCSMSLVAPFTATGLNMYDIRKKCNKGELCYDFDRITKFMNKPSTRQALHISDKSGEWKTCSKHVFNQFTTDMMRDVSSYVSELVDNNIAALIYAGDTDYICNYIGNKAWTVDLKWKHQEQFKASKAYEWKKQGLAKSYKGLTFLQVYDAGHMVPHDQPEVALEMITDFVQRYS